MNKFDRLLWYGNKVERCRPKNCTEMSDREFAGKRQSHRDRCLQTHICICRNPVKFITLMSSASYVHARTHTKLKNKSTIRILTKLRSRIYFTTRHGSVQTRIDVSWLGSRTVGWKWERLGGSEDSG